MLRISGLLAHKTLRIHTEGIVRHRQQLSRRVGRKLYSTQKSRGGSITAAFTTDSPLESRHALQIRLERGDEGWETGSPLAPGCQSNVVVPRRGKWCQGLEELRTAEDAAAAAARLV